MNQPRLTIFFIVEPPKYEGMACYLAASIRSQFDEPVDLVGYCPKGSMAQMNPKARAIFDRLGVDIRPIDTEGRFDPAYPHGNKMLAALEPRNTAYSAFMDSDMLFIAPNRTDDLIREGHVSVAAATSMYWTGQNIWEPIYAACGMDLPEERIWLSRQRRRPMMPYFNAGLIVFPEGPLTPSGDSFAEVWMQLAARIDQIDIVKKRPYLDQMSLPLAIRAAGLNWHILPEEQHYILGGVLRGQPLPKDRDIRLIHYRNAEILREVGCVRLAKNMLEKHASVRRISQVDLTGTTANE